jgi:hypothetical protein
VTQWKKIITSGSNADLNQITASAISLTGIGDVSSSIADVQNSILLSGNTPWDILDPHISYTGGNVGIGTTTPGEKLEVAGNISASGTIEANAFSIQGFSLTTVDSNTVTYSGSNQFGSGSTPSTTTHQFTGSILITGSGIFPDTDGTIDLGDYSRKFSNLYAINTFFGGVHEINLETEGLDQMQEGTVLSLKDGILQPCEKEGDPLVMGIVSKGENFPIVLGAEPVLITGKIKAGDYIITSKVKGHGKGINPRYIYSKQLFGKIIAQAIEDGKGKSHTIKAMIRKM